MEVTEKDYENMAKTKQLWKDALSKSFDDTAQSHIKTWWEPLFEQRLNRIIELLEEIAGVVKSHHLL